MADGKRCARCKQTKPTNEFGPSKRTRDGLFPYCRECKRAADRASNAKHREKRSAAAKARYAANPGPAKARRRKRYYEDPQRAVREAVEWGRRNPDRRREIAKRWQQANLQGKVREYTRKRYATRKGAQTIPFTPEQLQQRLAYYGGRCWVCRDEATEWDHVKPLTKGGWHCLSNLRPICRRCNAVKRDRWPYPV